MNKLLDTLELRDPPETNTGGPADIPPLPAIEDCATLIATVLERPKELIEGIAHQGTKMVLGGGSKTFKTWSLIDIAVSIATGTPWWNFNTLPGRVLYINFEIPTVFFQERLKMILHAKKLTLPPCRLDHWGLRGRAVSVDELLPQFISRTKGANYSTIVIDPTYKLMGNREENAAGDIASLLNAFERIAVETEALVVFGAHFSKGNQSAKESIDRISGSGVFTRDPDTILTLTKHEVDGAFVVEPILRNLPPVEPFCVRWEYPLFNRVDLDATKLKKAVGRSPSHDPADLLEILGNGELTTGEWLKLAEREEGIKERNFYDIKRTLVKSGIIFKTKITGKWTRKTV